MDEDQSPPSKAEPPQDVDEASQKTSTREPRGGHTRTRTSSRNVLFTFAAPRVLKVMHGVQTELSSRHHILFLPSCQQAAHRKLQTLQNRGLVGSVQPRFYVETRIQQSWFCLDQKG